MPELSSGEEEPSVILDFSRSGSSPAPKPYQPVVHGPDSFRLANTFLPLEELKIGDTLAITTINGSLYQFACTGPQEFCYVSGARSKNSLGLVGRFFSYTLRNYQSGPELKIRGQLADISSNSLACFCPTDPGTDVLIMSRTQEVMHIPSDIRGAQALKPYVPFAIGPNEFVSPDMFDIGSLPFRRRAMAILAAAHAVERELRPPNIQVKGQIALNPVSALETTVPAKKVMAFAQVKWAANDDRGPVPLPLDPTIVARPLRRQLPKPTNEA